MYNVMLTGMRNSYQRLGKKLPFTRALAMHSSSKNCSLPSELVF